MYFKFQRGSESARGARDPCWSSLAGSRTCLTRARCSVSAPSVDEAPSSPGEAPVAEGGELSPPPPPIRGRAAFHTRVCFSKSHQRWRRARDRGAWERQIPPVLPTGDAAQTCPRKAWHLWPGNLSGGGAEFNVSHRGDVPPSQHASRDGLRQSIRVTEAKSTPTLGRGRGLLR